MSNLRALLRALTVVPAASMLMAACGSSPTTTPDTSAPDTTAPGTTAPPAEHGSYAHCLAEHGVDEPPAPALGPQSGPGVPPAGVDQPTWEQALQTCASLAPGPPGP